MSSEMRVAGPVGDAELLDGHVMDRAALVASYQNPTVKAVFDKVYKGTGISAY